MHRRLGRGPPGNAELLPMAVAHMPCCSSPASHPCQALTPEFVRRPAGSFVPKQKATKADLAPCPVNTFQQFTAQASCQVGLCHFLVELI